MHWDAGKGIPQSVKWGFPFCLIFAKSLAFLSLWMWTGPLGCFMHSVEGTQLSRHPSDEQVLG